MARTLMTLLVVLALSATEAAAAPDGKLKQLPLPAGCLDDAGAGGCLNIVAPMTNVGEPAMRPPDGTMLYVPARSSNTINYFARDPASGELTEVGCRSFATPAPAGCTPDGASPLDDATAVAVSRDGTSLYVVGGTAGGTAADGIAHYILPPNGVPQFNACFNADGSTGCSPVPVFANGNPAAVAVSPDGTSVYVGNYNAHSIVVFNRVPATGALNQNGLTDAQKCVVRVAAHGCTVEPRLGSVRDLEVTPDDKQVLVTNDSCPMNFVSCYGMSALDRTPNQSPLTPHPGPGGCVSGFGFASAGACGQRDFFYGPTQIAIAPDGRRIYANVRPSCCTGTAYAAIMAVDRDPVTGTIAGDPSWCAGYPGSGANCAVSAPSLDDVFDVALSPNGVDLYSAGYGGQRIGVFDVAAATGRLTPKPAPLGCLAVAAGCGQTLAQGTNVEYVVPSPEPAARHVYALGLGKIFSFAVDHAPRCASFTTDTAHNMAVAVSLQCSDADGDPLSYEILSQPVRGQLAALQGDTITYGPLVGTSGEDSFQYRATAAGVTADTATATVRVASAPLAIVDADSDGSPATADCDDGNARIRPGVREIPGNAVDENCDGRRAAGTLGTLRNKWSSTTTYTDVTELRMTRTPRGARGQIRCSGKRCKFKRVKVRRRGRAIDFVKALKRPQRRFRPGQRVEVRVTAPNYNGKVVRYRIRPRTVPGGKTLCLPAGKTKPRRRC